MLVIAPLIVIVVATIVGFMISLVGSVTIANSRSQVQYDAQEALNQIEQDAFLSTAFVSSYTPPSPQGKNDATAPFISGSNDIIFNQQGVSSNPADPARELVYYANRPNACGGGNHQVNDPFSIKIVYFIKNNSLYRRSIVPTWNTNATPDANTVCSPVWQRNSCTTISGNCVTKDALLLTNVTSLAMTVTYYKKSDPSKTPITGDLSTADTLNVALTIGAKAGGETTTYSTELAASRSDS